MGNVARLMQELGHQVSGSDKGVYPPMSTLLKDSGIRLFEGFDPARLESGDIDLVVVGNAVTRGNPEVEWLLNTREIPFVSLPALIQAELLKGRSPIVIAGTHGKTTTSSMAAWLLKANGFNPGWLIGGVPGSLETGARVTDRDRPFVIEGDEYDSAFFDKRSKFIHYLPRILVINQIEYDHADIFRDLEDVKRSFRHLIRLVPEDGFLVINGDDPVTAELLPVDWTRVVRVGAGRSNDCQIHHFSEDASGARFSLYWQEQPWANISWPIPGEFNARNAAMAAVASALAVYPDSPRALDLTPLERFKGVRRRQELRFQKDWLTVIEDFAHHPTAVSGLLESLRLRFPEHQIYLVFEPRSNTSTTRVMEDAWLSTFLMADRLLLAPIYRENTIEPARRLDRAKLIQGMKEAGKAGFAADRYPQLLEELKAVSSESEVPLCLAFCSNGSFGGILDQFLESIS